MTIMTRDDEDNDDPTISIVHTFFLLLPEGQGAFAELAGAGAHACAWGHRARAAAGTSRSDEKEIPILSQNHVFE